MTTDTKRKIAGEAQELAPWEIDQLPAAEFEKLSEADKQRHERFVKSPAYFHSMNLENIPPDVDASEHEPCNFDFDFDEQERGRVFPLGRVVSTPAALEDLEPDEITHALDRHVSADWGDCSRDDSRANHRALKEGNRLFSVYHSRKGKKFWVITEADRSSTTVLLPEDY